MADHDTSPFPQESLYPNWQKQYEAAILERFGLCSLLSSRKGWEICGEATDGREAVEKCNRLKPDLLHSGHLYAETKNSV